MRWGRLFRREGENMTEPIVDYTQRAGARERPSIWVEPDESLNLFAHTRDEGMLYAATGQTFFADISIFQPLVNDSYPYPVLGFRADSGNSTDSNATGNWRYSDSHPDHIRVVIAYVVFKPGQSDAIFKRLKNLFGSHCPPQVVPEIDMESGPGFAGPGNHSSEANSFIATLAAWAGEQKQTQGYANQPDWAGSWPSHPSWMKRRLANYGSNPLKPGYYGVQYYGALPYPSPAGWPRTCAPFGSYVDMNMIPRTITQIEADYGIGEDVSTVDDFSQDALNQLTTLVDARINVHFGASAVNNPNAALNTGVSARMRLDRNAALGTLPTADEVAAAVVAALPPSSGGNGASLADITAAVKTLLNSTNLHIN